MDAPVDGAPRCRSRSRPSRCGRRSGRPRCGSLRRRRSSGAAGAVRRLGDRGGDRRGARHPADQHEDQRELVPDRRPAEPERRAGQPAAGLDNQLVEVSNIGNLDAAARRLGLVARTGERATQIRLAGTARCIRRSAGHGHTGSAADRPTEAAGARRRWHDTRRRRQNATGPPTAPGGRTRCRRVPTTPPRRGASPGAARLVTFRPRGRRRPARRAAGFGGIGDARAYTPRGRTVAERDQRTRSPRAGRTTDPFRPALQVLDGGQPPRARGRAADARTAGRATQGRRRKPQPEPRQPRGAATARDSRPPTQPPDPTGVASSRRHRDETAAEPRARRAHAADRGARPDGRPPARPAVPVTAAPARTPERPDRRRTVTGPRVGRVRSRRGRRPRPPKLANSTRRLRLGTVLALSAVRDDRRAAGRAAGRLVAGRRRRG